MSSPLIAIVGDITLGRSLDPPLADAAKARKAAEELGAELARQGARLLVYGGPFLEADVVRGYCAGKPKEDHSILMWFTKSNEPPPFPEEAIHPKLFLRRAEKGADWEVAFYRAIARADGIILMGGGNATKIAGGIAGVLFVTAQQTANPIDPKPQELALYARRSIPYALAIGFVAGLTADAVLGRLLGLDVVRTTGIAASTTKT